MRYARAGITRWRSSASAASRSRPNRAARLPGARRPGCPQPDGHAGPYRFAYEVASWHYEARCWWSTPARSAQTLANVYQARPRIVPLLSQIDLRRRADRVRDRSGRNRIGAPLCDLGQDRAGIGMCWKRWSRLRRRGTPGAAPRPFLVDSWYDQYLGVVILVRVKDAGLSPARYG